MFNLFGRKKKPDVQPASSPRGVLPTYVTDETVVLSKACPSVSLTYEVRLALYMAVSRRLHFVLAIRPGSQVSPDTASLLAEHGGEIEETQLDHYSVYVGHADPSGQEDGWVLGDSDTLQSLNASLRSSWLRERLVPGAKFAGTELEELASVLGSEVILIDNIDGENVGAALLGIVSSARSSGGHVFVQ